MIRNNESGKTVWVKVQISAEDYEALVQHLAQDKMGKPLVAVHSVRGDGAFGQHLLERELQAARPRNREGRSSSRTDDAQSSRSDERAGASQAHNRPQINFMNQNDTKTESAGARTHDWSSGGQFCSCGQDTVTCQGCGKLTCGDVAIWRDGKGNIGPCCFAKYGLGHSGTRVVDVGSGGSSNPVVRALFAASESFADDKPERPTPRLYAAAPAKEQDPNCPICNTALIHYDGALGYESMVCHRCDLDINDWPIYERAKANAWQLYQACRMWELAEKNGGVSMADLRTIASDKIRAALALVEKRAS